MTRMARGAAVLFATVALAAGVFVSGPKAAPPLCGARPCAEEIAAACGTVSGADFRACKKLVLDQCKISGETFCSCTNPALPPCTTGTTTPPSACCTQSTPGGPFDQCAVVGLSQCLAAGGRFLVGQTCTPNPCETTTTSTTSTSTSTTTTTGLPDCVGFVILDPDDTITTIPRGEPVDVPVRAASPTGGTFDVFLLDGGAGGEVLCPPTGCLMGVFLAPGETKTVHFTYTAAATAPSTITLTVSLNPHSVGFTCGFGSSGSTFSKTYPVSP